MTNESTHDCPAFRASEAGSASSNGMPDRLSPIVFDAIAKRIGGAFSRLIVNSDQVAERDLE